MPRLGGQPHHEDDEHDERDELRSWGRAVQQCVAGHVNTEREFSQAHGVRFIKSR